MPRYDELPRRRERQDLPLTNDKTPRAPKVRLEADGTGRMTAKGLQDGEVTHEFGTGRGTLGETHQHVAQARAKMGLGTLGGRGRGTRRGTGSIRAAVGGLGTGRTEGTGTGHAPSCLAVFGDGDPCTCGGLS